MKTLYQRISSLTISQVLLIGIFFRVLAIIFSKGYAFHDDHFEMAELVDRWRQGINFLWTGSPVHVFSLVYPGAHYLIFKGCYAIGLSSPEQIMFVVRIFHALFSLLAITYSYKLVLRLTNDKPSAIIIALCFAIFWIFPFMSVRNLREFVCIPFLLMGTFYLVDPKFSYRSIFLSALFFALAFTVRLQILFIPLGMGLYLLFQKGELKKALIFAACCIVGFFITQGLFDIIYYGNPFASVMEYLRFNSDTSNIEIQPQGPWYQYIATVAGIVWGLPFILLVIGYGYALKINPATRLLFFGSLLFFIFHSYYSNKQERFILPFIPYFLILGVIGFKAFYEQRKNSKWLPPFTKIVVGWFLFFNTIGLFVLSVTYTKRSRVEAMNYLRKRGDVTNIIMESEHGSPRPPLFYLSKQINYYALTAADSIPLTTDYITTVAKPLPNYIIMTGEENFESRISRLKKLYPTLKHEMDIAPSLVDDIAYRLNPTHNENETWRIYKIK